MTQRKIQYWVIPPEADCEFVACMENVLDTYLFLRAACHIASVTRTYVGTEIAVYQGSPLALPGRIVTLLHNRETH